PATLNINKTDSPSILASLFGFVGEQRTIFRDAINPDGGKWSAIRWIDQQALRSRSNIPDVDAGLFLTTIAAPVEVTIPYPCRLIDHPRIEVVLHPLADRREIATACEVAIATPLLLLDLVLGLGQGAIFQPAIRVAHNDPMKDLLDGFQHA